MKPCNLSPRQKTPQPPQSCQAVPKPSQCWTTVYTWPLYCQSKCQSALLLPAPCSWPLRAAPEQIRRLWVLRIQCCSFVFARCYFIVTGYAVTNKKWMDDIVTYPHKYILHSEISCLTGVLVLRIHTCYLLVLTCMLWLQFQSTTSAQVQPSGEDEEQEEDTVAWVNAAMGRIFWDFLSEPYWAEVVSKKIQMKLSKIRVSREKSPTHTLTLHTPYLRVRP